MAATAITLGVTAAISAYQAHKQNEATEKAAKAQTDAGDKAIAAVKEGSDAAAARFAPFQQLGQGALGPLAEGLGIPFSMGGTAAPAAPTGPAPLPAIPDLTNANKADVAKYAARNAPIPGLDAARAEASSAAGQRASSYGGSKTMSTSGGLGLNLGSFTRQPNEPVNVLAPDGTPGSVPFSRLQEALSHGYREATGGA